MLIMKQMNTRLGRALVASVATVMLLVSCGSPKKYAYLQNVELAKKYAVEADHHAKVQVGDRISIYVGSSYPDLARPFNGGGFDTSVPGLSGSAPQAGALQEATTHQAYGYTVDSAGEINFPILGRVRVKDLTLEEVAQRLERMIISSKYVTDPRVEVMFANFQVYMLGAVAGQGQGGATGGGQLGGANTSMFSRISGLQGGVLRVSDRDRLNILEALAMTGDLPVNANIEKVHVIRREGEAYTTYRLNMKSVDIFNSPGFNLKQNDIVYVEARYRRSEMEGIERVLQVSGYIFSSIASVVAVLALVKK